MTIDVLRMMFVCTDHELYRVQVASKVICLFLAPQRPVVIAIVYPLGVGGREKDESRAAEHNPSDAPIRQTVPSEPPSFLLPSSHSHIGEQQ